MPDYDKQLDFYTDIWGLDRGRQDSGIAFLAAEGSPEQYVVRLRQADEKRLDLIAFGAASAADVDTLAARLAAGGVQLVNEPGKLDTPGGGYGFRFFDIDGRTVEVSADVAVRAAPQDRGEGVHPGPALPRGHQLPRPGRHPRLLRAAPRLPAVRHPVHPHMGEVMYFMRMQRLHHSLAIARGPHASLHHVSFEMRGLDEYMRGTGRLMRAGVEKIWGPGRHMAGNNTFSYFLDPHGNTVEYTTELERLDEDTWHPHLYDFSDPEVTDQWGTANPMNEFVAGSRSTTPTAAFVAPPV